MLATQNRVPPWVVLAFDKPEGDSHADRQGIDFKLVWCVVFEQTCGSINNLKHYRSGRRLNAFGLRRNPL